MSRVLVRSGKDPFTIVGPEATLAQDVFNSNVGNYLFMHSVFRALSLPGAELVSNSTLSESREASEKVAARIDDEFDAFVVPLANAFRPAFARRLDNLAALVEQLTIPVVVVGVGAQTSLELDAGELDDIAPVVQRFVRAVLERSASVGVRGEFTADYLRGLGFPDSAVEVIGCPSLFLRGPGFRLADPSGPLSPDAPIALNLTEGVEGLGALVHRLAERHPGLVYLGQDKEDLTLLLWGEEPARETDPGVPMHPGHDLFATDRVRFPLETWSWLRYLEGVDYCVGTRLHGNVAGLLSGTPATLLAHDSRTWELARYHAMPHVRAETVPEDLRLEDLHAQFDGGPFNEAYADRFARFTGFLDHNGLAHVYAPDGDQGAAFDARVAELDLPDPVAPLTPDNPEQLHARLRWLRDGMVLDSEIHPQAYRHPFPYPLPPDQRTPAKREQRELRREVAGLTRELAATQRRAERREQRLRERLGRQAARLDRQTERLDRQASRLDALESAQADRLSRRLVRWLRR
jgi:hypothetical protein